MGPERLHALMVIWWVGATSLTTGTERVGREEGLTGRCGANYLPKGWQRAHCAKCAKNTKVASDQMCKAMTLTTDSSQMKSIQYLKGFFTVFRKSN